MRDEERGQGQTAPILVVEDDADIREALMSFLEEEGYVVAGVPNGKLALEFLWSHPETRLIVLDIFMPVMNGLEFRKQQLADAAVGHIPIIVVSGTTRLSTEDRANLRACAFVKKPHSLDDLFHHVARCAL